MAPFQYRTAQVTTTNQWDPRKVLEIYHNGNQTLSCVGTAATQWNSRCRWQFFGDASPSIIAGLDALANCNPRTVTTKQLLSLAKLCLCPHNHQYQAAQKVEEWQEKINQYLDEQGQSAALVANVDRLQRLLQDALDENKRLERRAENTVKVAQAALLSESEKLKKQLLQLKADFEMHKKLQAADIDALETQLQASRKHVEEAKITDEDRSREIDALKDQLEQSNARAETVKQMAEKENDGLKAELKASNELLRKEQTKAESTGFALESLREQLRDSKDELNILKITRSKTTVDLDHLRQTHQEQEKASFQEIESFKEQLQESNDQLDILKTTSSKTSVELDRLRQTIQDMRKKHADSQTKSSSQITTLQQQNHNLRVQAHFNVFRARVQFVVKQKQVEQVKKANSALMEQNRRLGEQVHDMDRRAAEQNRTLSSFKLRNVTRGVCAVVALRPLTFSIKRTSKAGGVKGQEQAL